METLIEKFLQLKSSYRNYDTKDALRRMQILRRSVSEVTAQGNPIALEVLGSISFGIVEPCSDADCVMFHYCEEHAASGECPLDCEKFKQESEQLKRALSREASGNIFKLEFLDCINLTYIEKKVADSPSNDDEILNRLLYYRTVGRPVNRPLICDHSAVLENDPEFMKNFFDWCSDILASYLSTTTHRLSFMKYNERIQEQGLILPEQLKNELQKYLS